MVNYDTIFKTLANKKKRHIIKTLYKHGDMYSTEIAEHVNIGNCYAIYLLKELEINKILSTYTSSIKKPTKYKGTVKYYHLNLNIDVEKLENTIKKIIEG